MKTPSPPSAPSAGRPFESEVVAHLPSLRKAARHLGLPSNADVDDLVQETVLRALLARDSFHLGSNCRAWLLRILNNSFINGYRRSRLHQRLVASDLIPGAPDLMSQAGPDPEQALIQSSLGDEVLSAMRSLPSRYQQVVLLADLQQLSYEETAARLGCPPGTVMSRLHRARRMLALALAGYAREAGVVAA